MDSNILAVFNRIDIDIEKGEGSYIFDENGQPYLDFISGVGVNQLGYRPQILKKAVDSIQNIIHLPYYFESRFANELSRKLVSFSNLPNSKVFFCTSGAEANESFVKFLFKNKIATNDTRNSIVVFSKSFHGRTLGVLNLTRQNSVISNYSSSNGFEIIELPYNDIEAFETYTSNNEPLAILIEPIQGSGGINIASDDFLEHIQEYCSQTNAYLALDEVQCGMGRTGKMFSYTDKSIYPDFVMFGKGTGGGIPLSGVLLNERTGKNIKNGDHGTTWCNPNLSAACGIYTLEYIENKSVLHNVRERSLQFQEAFQALSERYSTIISDIRIAGLMIGISLNLTPAECKDLQLDLVKNGLLVDITQGNVIRLLPPLTLSSSEVVEALVILDNSFSKFFNSN